MARIGTTLPSLIGKACRRQGFAEQNLITRWREIVGADIADCALPIKLRRSPGRGAGATLEVAAEGGYATEIKHIEPLLLDRINTYFGRQFVGRIAIIQRALPDQRIRQRSTKAEIDEESAERIATATKDTHDPGLKAALRRLGQEMAIDRQNAKSS